MTENSSEPTAYRSIGVIGAGAWGTALAAVAARGGRDVRLWAMEPEVVSSIGVHHVNARFLPGIPLPPSIVATGDLGEAAGAEALLLVVPAQHLRATLARLRPRVRAGTPVVLCAKGIERETGLLLTEVLAAELPDCAPAILSGPSFARDAALGLPTAVTVAARADIAARLQASLAHDTFRPYASDDLVGVALGGAAKNVYAICTGIVAGMKLGESARAALLARSFAELSRLGEALGARSETLMGLSGLGDLVLTATSPTSRNYAAGLALGAGETLASLLAPGKPLAEGIATAPALVARARAQGIELPIAETMAAILDGTLTLAEAVPHLMGRPLTTE
ncbi:MAG TPA: NAD(P)H-dependent glycerol-3-phosphate dehydrogenase [Rhizomicrobium sp.]|nr:NAD(P)H-dependent glycerol-3-phosphate dehydrogenase [Rhizomicrobium sp.]